MRQRIMVEIVTKPTKNENRKMMTVKDIGAQTSVPLVQANMKNFQLFKRVHVFRKENSIVLKPIKTTLPSRKKNNPHSKPLDYI